MSTDRIVSVVVPLHNEERYLRKCLESVLSQTCRDIEVIVVDDNSTDNSLAIVRRLSYRDSRVRIIHLPENVGAQRARMAGVEAATGEWIMFVDSDDILRSKSVELLREAMELYGVDLVQMRFMRRFRSLNFRYGETYDSALTGRPIDGEDFRNLTSYIGMDSFISPSMCGKLYRTSLMRMVSRTPFDQFWGDDQIFNIDYLQMARSMAFIDYTGYIYRWGGRTTHFCYSDLQAYKNVYRLKQRMGQDSSCLKSEMKLLLRYYIRQLNIELGWTREAVVLSLRQEIEDPMWKGIISDGELTYLVDGEFAHLQQNALKSICRRLLR